MVSVSFSASHVSLPKMSIVRGSWHSDLEVGEGEEKEGTMDTGIS